MRISACNQVAGVVGSPIGHSLSPVIHNAWLDAAGLDGVYFAAEPERGGFREFARTPRPPRVEAATFAASMSPLPFKARPWPSPTVPAARPAGGRGQPADLRGRRAISADNTDGVGLLAAFAEQAPGFDPAAGPVVILGAGGAARGAVAAFLEAGAPSVRIVNRTGGPGGGPRGRVRREGQGDRAESLTAGLADANAMINATPAAAAISRWSTPRQQRGDGHGLSAAGHPVPGAGAGGGARTVDGLAMLIGQARPCFEAFFGVEPAGSGRSRPGDRLPCP